MLFHGYHHAPPPHALSGAPAVKVPALSHHSTGVFQPGELLTTVDLHDA
jgi:hypothetical protein